MESDAEQDLSVVPMDQMSPEASSASSVAGFDCEQPMQIGDGRRNPNLVRNPFAVGKAAPMTPRTRTPQTPAALNRCVGECQ